MKAWISNELQQQIDNLLTLSIPEDRKEILHILIEYIQRKKDNNEEVNLNFICTHNSRRSQFSQLWAKTASLAYGIESNCFSGGVEVTAFNERAVASVQRMGFKVESEGSENPKYSVWSHKETEPLVMFSKVFDDKANAAKHFASVMTCAHADENCPFVPGTEERISLRYEDPKAFDDTEQEAEMYDKRSLQIASELFYVYSQIR